MCRTAQGSLICIYIHTPYAWPIHIHSLYVQMYNMHAHCVPNIKQIFSSNFSYRNTCENYGSQLITIKQNKLTVIVFSRTCSKMNNRKRKKKKNKHFVIWHFLPDRHFRGHYLRLQRDVRLRKCPAMLDPTGFHP